MNDDWNRELSDAANDETVPWKAVLLDLAFAIAIGFILAMVAFLGLSGEWR